MPRDGDTVSELVARLNVGDDSPSLLQLGDRLLRRAEPVARAVCRGEARGLPHAEIEECVQDALEIVWRKVGEFEVEGAPFEAWVRGIALNVMRNRRRKRRDLLSEDGVIEAVDPAWNVLRSLRREERDSIVIEAIPVGLSAVEQDVLCLRYCHDQSRKTIAALCGLASAEEVRVVLNRARRHLHDAILTKVGERGHGASLLEPPSGE